MAWIFLITTTLFILVFLISERLKRSDILDVAWGIGFPLIAISSLLITQDYQTRNILITLLTVIWGIRLSLHIYFRNVKKKEDYRYEKLKSNIPNPTPIKVFVKIFLPQLLFMTIVSLPIYLSIFHPSPNTDLFFLDYIGIGIWIFGFVFETISDIQLNKFIEKKRENIVEERILKTGLWKYSRHPNYFGEVVLWWGIFIIASSTQLGIFAILGPLMITFLITKVSGIPMLEKRYDGDKEFEEYKKNTPVFFPIKLTK